MAETVTIDGQKFLRVPLPLGSTFELAQVIKKPKLVPAPRPALPNPREPEPIPDPRICRTCPTDITNYHGNQIYCDTCKGGRPWNKQRTDQRQNIRESRVCLDCPEKIGMLHPNTKRCAKCSDRRRRAQIVDANRRLRSNHRNTRSTDPSNQSAGHQT